jgi:transposase
MPIDGRSLDHATLESIRLQAVAEVRRGASPAQVAQHWGMSRSAVYAWLAQEAAGGVSALRAKPVPGRPTALDGSQVQALWQILRRRTPDQAGLEAGLWTRDLVGQLILDQLASAVSVWTVDRLLRRWGLPRLPSPYRPQGTDPARLAAWKRAEYPLIAQRARRAGAQIHWWADAAVDDAGGGSPRARWLCALTARGQRRFMIAPGALTPPGFLDFCQRLARDVGPRPVVLIADGQPAQRSNLVARWAGATPGQFALVFVPSAPAPPVGEDHGW